MHTIKEIMRESKRDPQHIYRALRLLEAYRNYNFKKQGRTFIFNEKEKAMIMDVLENGVAAAKEVDRD